MLIYLFIFVFMIAGDKEGRRLHMSAQVLSTYILLTNLVIAFVFFSVFKLACKPNY